MSIIKLPSSPKDFKYTSPSLNFTFPLATAVSPTGGPSFTVAGYKVSPFMGANLINQTLLTNTTVYFAYRDGDGNYLNNSYITGNIVMNFSFPLAKKVKGTVTCAYAGPSDTHWRNDSCVTKLYFGRDLIQCVCKHMSFYTLIDSSFNQTQYNIDMQRTFVSLEIQNWLFFVVVAYLAVVLCLGIIYSNNMDNTGFRFINDKADAVMLSEREGRIALTALLFTRRVYYQSFSRGKRLWCCSALRFMFTKNLAFQGLLTSLVDPTLPRVYKFLLLYVRLMVVFCLSFVFYGKSSNPDPTATTIVPLCVGALIGAVILGPLPSWLLAPLRSHFFLVYEEKVTESGSEPGKQPPKQVAPPKVEIDPTLPIKLLFLLNASSHEKLISDATQNPKEWFAGGDSKQVAAKLRSLELDPQTAAVSQRVKSGNLTEVDLISNQKHAEAVQKSLEKVISPKKYITFNQQHDRVNHGRSYYSVKDREA